MAKKRKSTTRSPSERRAKAALNIGAGKLRYSVIEAQVALGIANTKFWAEVKRGRIRVHYDDARRGFCMPDTLQEYVAAFAQNTKPPRGAASGARAAGRDEAAA